MERRFAGWDQPLVKRTAEELRGRAFPEPDRVLVWVPSGRAGRHLVNELFHDQEAEREAFHPPQLITPARFVSGLRERLPGAAGRMDCLLAFSRVLAGASSAELDALFPGLPPGGPDPRWCLGMARQLLTLRERLAEDRMDFRGVAAGELPREAERWEALGRLESAYLQQLAEAGLVDPDASLAEWSDRTYADSMIERVLVVGVLNLSRLQEWLLREMESAGIPVEIHIPAPEAEAEAFDACGRPLPEVWNERPLPEALVEACVRRDRNPRDLVESVMELAGEYDPTEEAFAAGCGNPDLLPFFTGRSRLSDCPFYDPMGTPLLRTGWGRLIRLLGDWKQSGTLETLFELALHPLMEGWIHRAGFRATALQASLVRLRQERFLQDRRQVLDAGLTVDPPLQQVREFVEALEQAGLGRLEREGLPAGLWELLQSVGNQAGLTPEELTPLLRVQDILQKINRAGNDWNLRMMDAWELLRMAMEEERIYPERSAGERPVSGWLELPWEVAPHLVLLSLPDSEVPGSRNRDPFLAPMLCRALGLRGPDDESAFHAFRLRMLMESRRAWGRFDLLLPDNGLDDAPEAPCRFLFMAEKPELLDRIDRLLKETGTEATTPAADFGTAPILPDPKVPASLSVTGFAAYLANPYHFYLQQVLGWELPEALPRELDALTFGILAHRILEQLNRTEEGIPLQGEEAIRTFLEEALALQSRRLFGTDPAIAVRIQLESLKERLRAAAGVIAGERAAGWEPVRTEWAFHREEGEALTLEGIPVHGKIDLVERHAGTGQYRIVDYKTSDKAEDPRKKHLTFPRSAPGNALVPETDFDLEGRIARWRDLQMPLYLEAFRKTYNTGAVCAYFNLPKAVGDTGLSPWEIGDPVRLAALDCAKAVVRQIRAGAFPPPENPRAGDKWLSWFGEEYPPIPEMPGIDEGGTAP